MPMVKKNTFKIFSSNFWKDTAWYHYSLVPCREGCTPLPVIYLKLRPVHHPFSMPSSLLSPESVNHSLDFLHSDLFVVFLLKSLTELISGLSHLLCATKCQLLAFFKKSFSKCLNLKLSNLAFRAFILRLSVGLNFTQYDSALVEGKISGQIESNNQWNPWVLG